MGKNKLTIAFEKLGIKTMTDRSESAEEPNIRFSKFDTCYISCIEYEDGRIEESKKYTRLSETFESAYKVLEDWYEIDYQHYRRDKDFLSCDYVFTSKYDLPSITININKFHNDFYKIKVGYNYDSRWYEIRDHINQWHETKNLENDLTKILEEQLNKSDDKNVIREIKLKKLLTFSPL